MRTRPSPAAASPGAWAFCFVVLGLASAAQACGAHVPASISTVPGLAFFRPDILLLLPILSGALERPFYTLAGYRRSTLGYAIQANLLAYLASNAFGCVGIGVGLAALDSAAVAGVLAAPLIALIVKLAWFARVPREAGYRRRFGWFLLATLFSMTTIALVPLWMNLLGTDRQSYAMRVSPIQPIVILAAAGAALITHVSLFGTLRRHPRAEPQRGFEVLPAPAVAMPVAASR